MRQTAIVLFAATTSSAVYAASPNPAATLFGYFPLIAALLGIAVLAAVMMYNSPGTEVPEKPTFEQDRDFVRLKQPQPTSTKSHIEVVEIFSYTDPKSYQLAPTILRWAHELEESVRLVRMPIIGGDDSRTFAKAFYAAQSLSVTELIHGALFDAIHLSHQELSSEYNLAQFFRQYGIDPAVFHGAFNASTTMTATQKAQLILKGCGIEESPAFIVNGTYLVTEERAGSQPRLLEILDFLVARERERKLPANTSAPSM